MRSLDQVVLGAGLQRLEPKLVVGIVGQHDDRDVRSGDAEVAQRREHVVPLLGEIEQHAARAAVEQHLGHVVQRLRRDDPSRWAQEPPSISAIIGVARRSSSTNRRRLGAARCAPWCSSTTKNLRVLHWC